MKGRHLLCALLLIGATQCIAYPNAAQRVKAFAALPDWTGLCQSQWLKSASTPSGKADGGDAGFAEVLNHVRLLEHPPIQRRVGAPFTSCGGQSCGAKHLYRWISVRA